MKRSRKRSIYQARTQFDLTAIWRAGPTILWKPPFVSRIAAEDRCHLNGLAMEDGKARYVTAGGQTDVANGWRDCRQDGSCVIDVTTNAVVCDRLSMPHYNVTSPLGQ